jgi:DNA-binding transcriptional LysR family regulator
VQSAASAAIASIEGRHGAKLFHRVGRGIELTEIGRAFLDEARAVLARVAVAELMLGNRCEVPTVGGTNPPAGSGCLCDALRHPVVSDCGHRDWDVVISGS